MDVQNLVKDAVKSAVDGASPSKSSGRNGKGGSGKGGSALSGGTGLALGAGAAALAPLAVKKLAQKIGVDSVGDLLKSPAQALEGVGDRAGSALGDKVSNKVDEAGGPSGILGDTVKNVLPFGGGSDSGGGGKNNAEGVGKGRRMPVQQAIDIGVDIETVYNQFTQFEDWPTYMHRVTNASQDDDCTINFAAKIWGKTKEFTAKIETQRPDERIKWKVSQGINHTGVVTFHELGPHLTRVMVNMDLQPGGPLEKMARGARYLKRAVRADLHRFKALIEMSEQETGAWRGVIEDGHVVEEHDPSYDEDREYADIEDLVADEDEDDDGEEDEDDEQDEGEDEPQAEADEDEEEEPEEDEDDPQRGQTRSRASDDGRSRGRGRSGSSRRSSPGHESRRRSASRRS